MFHALAPKTSTHPEFKLGPALKNPSIACCHFAWERGYRAGMKATKSRMLARKFARDAFCQALPALSGLENIGNFLACVAFAMATGVFVDGDGAELLESAQVALDALLLRRKTKLSLSSKWILEPEL
jgi:hypothetical protein